LKGLVGVLKELKVELGEINLFQVENLFRLHYLWRLVFLMRFSQIQVEFSWTPCLWMKVSDLWMKIHWIRQSAR
jgi:hypothetical protein